MVHCWALTDHRPGTANQVLGIARRSGYDITEKKLDYNRLASLPNYCMFGNGLRGLKHSSSQNIIAPWPCLVISAGRRTAPVAAYIKAKHPQTKLVHIMRPEWRADVFDMLILPQHDEAPQHDNLITTLGASHSLNDDILFAARARQPLNPDLLPQPWTMLALGGNTSHGALMLTDIDALMQAIAPLTQSGTILLTSSRRTPSALALSAIKQLKERYPNIVVQSYFADQNDENPYHAWLAQADNIVVTGDSVSMISEAAYTGKPTYIYVPKQAASPKHHRFIDQIIEVGHAKKLNHYDPLWKGSARLDESARVARLIREMMG